MKKVWKIVDFENCDDCGDNVQCLTDCLEVGEKNEPYFYDGDCCRCVSCNLSGTMVTDGERAYILWEEK